MMTQFQTKSGSTVEIDIDEDSHVASVFDLAGNRIGTIEFNLIEHPGAHDDYYLKICNAFPEGMSGKYLHQGIGTKCVELMIEATGFPIVANDHDGTVQDDGSHLTGDAPVWVEKLRKLGLVS